MNKNDLIIKQQIEIEELKSSLQEYEDVLKGVSGMLFSVGAPLNDNILNFNKEQRAFLHRIAQMIGI